MGRISKMQLTKETRNVFGRDTKDVIASYERVNTAASIYVDATYRKLLTEGIGGSIADLVKSVYGESVITKDVHAFIVAQNYSVSHVFQLASEKLLASAIENVEASPDSLHNDDHKMIATKYIDINGLPVYVRTKSDGTPYKARYTFGSLFKAFVEPALLNTNYDGITSGNVTYKLKPVKSVAVIS